MFLYEEAAHMYERAYEVNPDASILKPYLYCCYKYLPEDAYGKMLSKEQTYLNLNSELKEDMKEALQQADLDIEAQVLEKWKREYRRTDN